MEMILSKVAIMLVPALLAIILHEVSHGYVAERFGDPTARLLGRLNFIFKIHNLFFKRVFLF